MMLWPASKIDSLSDEAAVVLRRLRPQDRFCIWRVIQRVTRALCARRVAKERPDLSPEQVIIESKKYLTWEEAPDVRLETLDHYADLVGLIEEWNAMKVRFDIPPGGQPPNPA